MGSTAFSRVATTTAGPDVPAAASAYRISAWTLITKRLIDLTVASIALLLLLPFLLALGIAIRLESPGPALFRQRRAGRGGKPFELYKFRTMSLDAETRVHNVIDLDELPVPLFNPRADPRVTRPGHWLRRWSLDELPQLFNVLRGEMTLVGPRPEQIDLVCRYPPEHQFRWALKPGLTGPMQVGGRKELNFYERMRLEREYADQLSLRCDLKLMLLTPLAVLRRRGAF